MTTYTPDLYTITETRIGSTDEWFVMTAPIDVISAHFYMHPTAAQRIIDECADPLRCKCVLAMPRAARIENGGMFIARAAASPTTITGDDVAALTSIIERANTPRELIAAVTHVCLDYATDYNLGMGELPLNSQASRVIRAYLETEG